MLKKLSFLSVLFTVFFVPMMAFASSDAAEEAASHPEASPLFITILTILSIVTLVYMIFLTIKDHG